MEFVVEFNLRNRATRQSTFVNDEENCFKGGWIGQIRYYLSDMRCCHVTPCHAMPFAYSSSALYIIFIDLTLRILCFVIIIVGTLHRMA